VITRSVAYKSLMNL